jgi:methyl-accepting chemotaxis protein
MGIIISVLAAFWGLHKIDKSVDGYRHLITVTERSVHDITDMNYSFKIQIQEWKNVLLRGYDAGQREKYWAKFKKKESEILSKTNSLLDVLESEEAKDKVQHFKRVFQAAMPKYAQGYEAFKQGNYDPKVGDKAVKGLDREPAKLLEEAQAIIFELVEEESSHLDESAHTGSLVSITILIIVAVVVIAFLLWGFNRGLTQPTASLEKFLGRLAEGDLTASSQIRSDDEIGRIADSARSLQEYLLSVSSALNTSSSKLDVAFTDIHSSSERVTEAANDQSTRSEAVAAAVHEMATASQEISGNATTAAEAVESTREISVNGTQAMKSTVSGINQLAEEIGNAADVVQKLEEESQNIGTVLSVIQGIAEQTNLLALNAAIEAARAGEQGRGFAVVADEVRTLAQKTQDSTTEIQDIIDNIQKGAQAAVSAMSNGTERTATSVEQVNEAGSSLEQINEQVMRIHDMNMQIAAASEEQTQVIDEISGNVREIADLSIKTTEYAAESETILANLDQIREEQVELASRLKS